MAPNTDMATRSLVVVLKAPCVGKSSAEVASLTGISARQVNRIYARALKRGFDSDQRPLVIKDEFLKDAPRSGRQRKQTDETEQQILEMARRDGENTYAELAEELSCEGNSISSTTVWRILKNAGYRKTKPSRKPGSTKVNNQQLWCLDRVDESQGLESDSV